LTVFSYVIGGWFGDRVEAKIVSRGETFWRLLYLRFEQFIAYGKVICGHRSNDESGDHCCVRVGRDDGILAAPAAGLFLSHVASQL